MVPHGNLSAKVAGQKLNDFYSISKSSYDFNLTLPRSAVVFNGKVKCLSYHRDEAKVFAVIVVAAGGN